MFHPALGIHEPKKMLMIRTDWQRLKSYLAGTLVLPTDPYPEPDYQEVTCEAELLFDESSPLAMDTESTRKREPFCITYSQAPGTGRLIRADRRDLLLLLQGYLSEWRTPILFHNWLYDWPVTEAMGLALPYRKIVDTMALVYHLGNLPQGLKALAFRECGMTMQDFDDVVLPHSKQNVLWYYTLMRLEEWPKPEPRLDRDESTGLWTLYKPQSLNTKLKRFYTDYEKNPDEKDVFVMWEKNWLAEQTMVTERLGEWPGKCISHVPFDQMLYYACRDADALLRLRPLLMRMRQQVRRVSQEHWRVA